MTIYESLFTSYRQLFMTVHFLFLIAQLYLIFASFRDGRNRGIRLFYMICFAVSTLAFWLLMIDITWEINYPNGERPLPRLLAAFGSLPLTVMIICEAVMVFILVAECRDLLRYRKHHPSFDAIKETMDLLPVGITFGRTDGTVVFCNAAMHDFSRKLTGKEITDWKAFQKTINSLSGNLSGQETHSDARVIFPDRTGVWQITSGPAAVDGQQFVQLTATDITKQAEITEELEEKNKKLRELRMRLDIYNRQADRIITAQELLTARMTVHNEVGNVLLESRHYLKDPSSIDEKLLLQALKNTNAYLLKEYEEDDTERDPLSDAVEMAEGIGVEIQINGIPPEKDPCRTILAAAICECATNTVKHADGDQLQIQIQSADSETTFILQNNGNPPGDVIRETGGLLSLRTLVEKEGGSMEVCRIPAFILTIKLPW